MNLFRNCKIEQGLPFLDKSKDLVKNSGIYGCLNQVSERSSLMKIITREHLDISKAKIHLSKNEKHHSFLNYFNRHIFTH